MSIQPKIAISSWAVAPLTSEGFDCVNNLLSIFRKHRFVVNRLNGNQVGFHLI
jgi:hypothetical protein